MNYSSLSDFDRTFTGYTNRWLEVRNDIKTPVLNRADELYKEDVPVSDDYVFTVYKDIEKTPVSNVFFSKRNIDYLQEMMRKIIYKESGHIIGRQSDGELLIIMRSYYLSDAKNLSYDIPCQVAELNRLVLKYAVYDEILPRVKGYATFLNDNIRTNVVVPHPRLVSMKGARINRGFSDLI